MNVSDISANLTNLFPENTDFDLKGNGSSLDRYAEEDGSHDANIKGLIDIPWAKWLLGGNVRSGRAGFSESFCGIKPFLVETGQKNIFGNKHIFR